MDKIWSLWMQSKTHYKCFEAFDWPIRKKNFTNWSIKEFHLKAFAALCRSYPTLNGSNDFLAKKLKLDEIKKRSGFNLFFNKFELCL